MALFSKWLKMKKNLEENLNILIYFIILSSILFLLKITWMKWGGIIIDIGRDIYIPLEISKGKILYSDIFYTNGPFPIYLHTLLYKLLGAHIHMPMICGIVITFLTALLLYKISRFFMGPICGSLIPLTFIFVCAFGNYVGLNNYNFIFPYTYTATYGILFSIAAFYYFIKFIYYKGPKNLIFYSIFTSLVLLCKIDIGMPLLVTSIPIIFFYRPIKNKRVIYILISLSSIIITLIVYGLFCFKTNFLTIMYKNFYKITINLPTSNNYFAKRLIGTQDLIGNMRLLAYSTFSYLFILICFLSFDYILNNLENNIVIKSFITFTIYLLTSIILIFFRNFITPYIQYRPLPLICTIIILYSFWKSFIKINGKENQSLFKTEVAESSPVSMLEKNSFSPPKDLPPSCIDKTTKHCAIFSISLFSLLLILRIILRVSAEHYGFYLLIPGLISYYLFFFIIIPDFLKKFTRNGLYYLASFILFVLLIINHFNFYSPIYEKRTLKISSKRGTIYHLNHIMCIRYRDLIEYLINNAKPNETLIVIPEGIDVNFFTAMDNPIFYNSYMPSILELKDKELEIISQIYKNKVDYIVIIQRETSEYGPPRFGIDYGKELFSWIKKNYEIIKTFGPLPFTTNEFGIAVTKRKIS